MKLEHYVQDNNFACATIDRYVLLVWRRQITVDGANACAMQLARLHTMHPHKKLGFLTLIEDPCSLSTSGEVRQIMSGALKKHSQHIGAAAIAYEMDGFWSAIARSVITAINVASRVAFPSEVFGDAQESISFVTRELRDASETRWQTLRAAMDAMRADREAGSQRG